MSNMRTGVGYDPDDRDPDMHVGKSADQIRRERHEKTIEAGIAEVLANATDSINKERDMPQYDAPVAPREDAFSASAQLLNSTMSTLEGVSGALENAYVEQSYWNNRVADLERTKELLLILKGNLDAGQANGVSLNKQDPRKF